MAGRCISQTELAQRWQLFGRFARKEKISAAALLEAVERAEKGLIDADLGGGVIKQRIARPGAGKSGGLRSVVLYRQGERAFFRVRLSQKWPGQHP